MKLTKADLVNVLFQAPEIQEYDISRKEINLVVTKFIEKLRNSIQNLDEDERIELRGFGTFGVKRRVSRTARNPRTGEPVEVPERKSTYFKPGRDLKNTLQGD